MNRHLPKPEREALWKTYGRVGWWLVDDFYQLAAFTISVFSALWWTLWHPRKLRWSDLWFYLDMCGARALPIASLICFSVGIILAFQGAVVLERFGQTSFVANCVSYAMLLELGPLMCAVIAIGRAGSAFAAEIGTMKVSEEIDALKTFGFNTHRLIVVPKVLAMFVTLPALTVYGCFIGLLGGLFVATIVLGQNGANYIDLTVDAIELNHVFQALIKSIFFSVIVAIIGCFRGFQAGSDAQGVGSAATSAVVSGIFWVVFADTLLTMFFSSVFP